MFQNLNVQHCLSFFIMINTIFYQDWFKSMSDVQNFNPGFFDELKVFFFINLYML